ncbi:Glycosyltransferase-like KOBITO 1 [Zea mays]|uniref:Glycosyltransferase-like KOBITO 1 n=1 Tax=Zea mays TaxID=4577 RepID=A0A1D6KAN7_MAIZE|nr:Glycosyltransferase-like KOBITO 1 [Zea mays]ONM00489.1 Glycosyltransferase-like KOBITO 1 [Zea mays]
MDFSVRFANLFSCNVSCFFLARYNERVVWTDKQLNLKLLRKGVLTRIYTPMTIVQSLRESGVFTSAITAGQPAVNAKLSPKETNAQSQNVTAPGNMTRVVRSTDSKASGRKILQAVDLAFSDTNVTAVPPLSPPSLDEHRHHSE